MHTTVLMAAYRKNYATYQEALQAWREGKDFRIAGTSTYCSIRDSHRFGVLDNVMLHTLDGGVYAIVNGRAI